MTYENPARIKKISQINKILENKPIDYNDLQKNFIGVGNADSLVSIFYSDFGLKEIGNLEMLNHEADLVKLGKRVKISLLYIEVFTNILLNSKRKLITTSINVGAKTCYEMASIFITIIEVCILTPTYSRISELRNEASLSLGKKSIYIGILSMLLSVILTFCSSLNIKDRMVSIPKNTVIKNDSLNVTQVNIDTLKVKGKSIIIKE